MLLSSDFLKKSSVLGKLSVDESSSLRSHLDLSQLSSLAQKKCLVIVDTKDRLHYHLHSHLLILLAIW